MSVKPTTKDSNYYALLLQGIDSLKNQCSYLEAGKCLDQIKILFQEKFFDRECNKHSVAKLIFEKCFANRSVDEIFPAGQKRISNHLEKIFQNAIESLRENAGGENQNRLFSKSRLHAINMLHEVRQTLRNDIELNEQHPAKRRRLNTG